MKHPSVAPRELDDDIVSESSVSFINDGDCNDAAKLKQALMFLKGAMKAKEGELARLREEKDAAIDSKFSFTASIMTEVGGLKNKVGEQTKMLAQVEKEKEQSIEQINLYKQEVENMTRKLTQAEQEKESSNASTLKNVMAEIGELKNEIREQKNMLLQAQKEKGEAFEHVKLCKAEIEEVTYKLYQTLEEKEVALELARKIKEEVADTRIGELEKALQTSQWKIEELEEKRLKEIGALKMKLNMDVEELDAKVKEAMEKAETAQMQVQTAKDEAETAARDRKAEVDSQLEIVAEMVKNATRAHEKSDAALNQRKGLSLGESVKTLSKLEEVEHYKCLLTLRPSVWKSSGTNLLNHSGLTWFKDALNCAPLKSGIFEWKIRVHSVSSNWLRMGVIASSVDASFHDLIGYTKNSWAYVSDGTALYDSKIVVEHLPTFLPHIKPGNVVRFVLDLTAGGTLSVSVNESPVVHIFSNMKSSIEKDEGFHPAAALYRETKIELIDFQYRCTKPCIRESL